MQETAGEIVHKLPPLILHPFSDAGGPSKLVESSRASLMLQGLLPTGTHSNEDLDRTLLDGRYCEVRMLYYVGKDLSRWIEQCLEFVEHTAPLAQKGIRFQSFASLLVEKAPESVTDKLRKWGVTDYKAIFARALGLNSIFADVPLRETLSNEFLRNYYRYADQLFLSRQNQSAFPHISPKEFVFDLYASGEYSRMLERSWEN